MVSPVASRRSPDSATLTIRFIGLAAAAGFTAGLLAWLLVRLFPPAAVARETALPWVFWITTLFLAGGSLALQRAVGFVRRERQTPFRRHLVAALTAGILFVGVQLYGLLCLVRNQDPKEVQTGANAFVTIFASLHAMHFFLALLFLTWVTLNALADRYDHEYYWTVIVCGWFWHALGIVWLVILGVILIAARGLPTQRSIPPDKLRSTGVESTRQLVTLPACPTRIRNRPWNLPALPLSPPDARW